MYANGQGVPKDDKEAMKWYRLAADQGYASAQNNLGLMYANGQGVPKDDKEAVKWYRLAADQGNANAQFNLGGRYANGQGVPQDYKEAVKWYRLAADQGNASAQFSLGVRYDNGQGVLQDFEEAVKWYRVAADQGNADAQNNLGAMYADGQGVHQSRVMAFALYNVSAMNDPSIDNKAASNREKLSSSMTTKEIAAGQALSREISKPGMLLKALDKYSKNPAVKEKATTASSELPVNSAPSQGPYPARPAKQPGLTSCNTRCNNADCYRTYDDGRKVHFQAKQKFNPINSQFEWDSGSC
jgi:TPR repeat protein